MINDWDKNIVLTQSWMLVKHPPPKEKGNFAQLTTHFLNA